MAERVAKAISAERDWARNNQVEERNALIEALMVSGEQVNFQALVTEDFDLQSALENWHAFCSDASCKCKLYPVLGHFGIGGEIDSAIKQPLSSSEQSARVG